MSVRKYATKIEAIILAFGPAEREAAMAGVEHVFLAARFLAALPDDLFRYVGGLMVEMVVSRKLFRTSFVQLAEDLLKGAPTLLGPHRVRIEQLVSQLLQEERDGKKANGEAAGAAPRAIGPVDAGR